MDVLHGCVCVGGGRGQGALFLPTSKHSINNNFFINIITLAFPLGSMNEGAQDKFGDRERFSK